MITTWKTCVENDNYEISNKGRVRRLTVSASTPKGYIFPIKITKSGYNRARLYKNGKPSYYFVHRLVLSAFIGKRSSKKWHVNHKNGNKLDNKLENLEYCTLQDNFKHAVRLGLTAKGERNSKSKITEKQVKQFRKLYYLQGFSSVEIARRFNLKSSLVNKCVNGETWSHIAFSKKEKKLKEAGYKFKNSNSGEKNPRAKLTEKDVKEIRKMYRPIYGIKARLAKIFNVQSATICSILNKRNWKNI